LIKHLINMAVSTIRNKGNLIRNETEPFANTADRIGGVIVDIAYEFDAQSALIEGSNTEIQSIKSALGSKADKSALEPINTSISNLQANKADKTELEEAISNISIGTILKGEKANEAAIKAIANPSRGDTYKASDTGNYWTYDGITWNNIGEFLPSDGASKILVNKLIYNLGQETNIFTFQTRQEARSTVPADRRGPMQIITYKLGYPEETTGKMYIIEQFQSPLIADWDKEYAWKDVVLRDEFEELDNATKGAQQFRIVSNNTYVYAIIDAENKILWGKKKDGSTFDPKGIPEDVKKALLDKLSHEDIVNEITDSGNPISASAIQKVINHKTSQLDFAFLYEDNKIPFYIQKGNVYANMPEVHQLRSDVNDIINRISNILEIVDIGDSLTAGAGGGGVTHSKVLQTLLGEKYSVINCGVGGENVPTIGARQGGVPAYFTEQFILPANTNPVEVSSVSNYRIKNLLFDAPVRLLRQGSSSQVNPCYVNGIECTLKINQTSPTSTDAVWTLQRNQAGDTDLSIEANTPLITHPAKDYRNSYVLGLWIGQNGGYSSNDNLVLYHKRMIEFSGTNEYLIIGLHTGTAASRSDIEMTMEKEFGLRYINWRKYISSLQAFYDLSMIKGTQIEPSQDDLNAIAVGSLPPAFWASATDSIHLNADGYTLLGYLRYNRLQLLGLV